ARRRRPRTPARAPPEAASAARRPTGCRSLGHRATAREDAARRRRGLALVEAPDLADDLDRLGARVRALVIANVRERVAIDVFDVLEITELRAAIRAEVERRVAGPAHVIRDLSKPRAVAHE